MRKFCKECGTELNEDHQHCKNCGTSVLKHTETEEIIVQKKPMTKRNKVMLGLAGSVIIILVSLHMWVNNHFSAESVEKRFEAAVEKHDSTQLAKLAVHEDGSSISKSEAKAFADLVKTGGNAYLNDLTNLVQNGKVLGIYDSYKVEVYDQFATYDYFVEGLSFTFNDEEFPIYKKDEDSITYGPLAPGKYTVEATFENDYGETSLDDTLVVAATYGEDTWIDMDIPISTVYFYVENYYDFDTTDAHILFNDEKYDIFEFGESEEIGPLLIDGSQHINIVVNMPWGEIISDDILIDESYKYVHAALISNDDYKEVTNTLITFGDEYINAIASKSIDSFTVATKEFIQEVEYNLDDDFYYAGQFEELQIDKSSITVYPDTNKPELYMDVIYMIKEDNYYVTDEPDLYEEEYTWNVNLVFNDEQDKWQVNALMYTSIWAEESDLDVIAGSGILYSPSEEAIKTAKTSQIGKELEEFMIEYTIASVDAINNRDFEYVSNFITEEGPRRTEAEEYIEYLDSKDIYEEWLGTELEDVSEIDDHSWQVTVLETFEIIKPDSTDVKSYRTEVIVKMVDHDFYVDELIKTSVIE